MNLKDKISLLVSLIFSILFAVSAFIIYVMFADFRKEEFESKLYEKAASTVKLLTEIKDSDKHLLQFIGKNNINSIFEENTLIFDRNFKIIYTSQNQPKINWFKSDLEMLKTEKSFLKKRDAFEVYGLNYKLNKQNYYVLISAIDNYGNRKLEYLVYLLVTSFLFFTTICWIVTSFVVGKLFVPLHGFHTQIKSINENNLDTRIAIKEPKDEINLLANEFNQMLGRIDKSYQKQKEFTSHASHELRTPIARITSQVENKIKNTETPESSKVFLSKLLGDIYQISELISSLLILSKLESVQQTEINKYRIDEIIFDAIEKLNRNYPEFKITLDIDDLNDIDSLMEIRGNESLLHIAISNLLKNACLYSENHQAEVIITKKAEHLLIKIINYGPTISDDEQKNLFEPFMRGHNSKGKSGLGLGLRIVHRILNRHNANIQYSAVQPNVNIFAIEFA